MTDLEGATKLSGSKDSIVSSKCRVLTGCIEWYKLMSS